MTDRRHIVGLLGMHALGSWAGPALAIRSKDPCKGKLVDDDHEAGPWPAPQTSLGVAGSHRHASAATAAVHRDFQAVIERNLLAMPGTALRRFVQGLHQNELDCLACLYGAASLNSAQPARLLDILAPALDVPQTQRLLHTQRFDTLYAAMSKAGSASAQVAIDAWQASRMVRPGKQPPSTDGKLNENPLDYTIKEIYLNYRTAPKGSYSVPAAMYETANFVGLRLIGSFSVGYTLGTAIQQTWQTLSPDTWDRFSDFIGSSVDRFAQSAGSIMGITPYASLSEPMHFQIGGLQEDLWGDFEGAGPRGWYAGGGDFAVTQSWTIRDRKGDCR